MIFPRRGLFMAVLVVFIVILRESAEGSVEWEESDLSRPAQPSLSPSLSRTRTGTGPNTSYYFLFYQSKWLILIMFQERIWFPNISYQQYTNHIKIVTNPSQCKRCVRSLFLLIIFNYNYQDFGVQSELLRQNYRNEKKKKVTKLIIIFFLLWSKDIYLAF